jgi:uncharacterized protein
VSRLAGWVFGHARLVLGTVLLTSIAFASRIPTIGIYTDFRDLLPVGHPYVRLHEDIQDQFGGANVVVLAVGVAHGTVFDPEVLALIHRVTLAADELPGVNHHLVASLTHRTVRNVYMTADGGLRSDLYYDPNDPPQDARELAALREAVLADPAVYGLLVSPDLKAALIRAPLVEGRFEYPQVFAAVQRIRAQAQRPGIAVHATGQPVLVGWVHSYLPQILEIFLYTAAIMLVLLIAYFRTLYGVLVPLAGVTLASSWGLGFIGLAGYNLDPLSLVIPFLIGARSLSHGIQLVERFYAEYAQAGAAPAAARRTFEALFRPGVLGVLSDAIGVLLIAIGGIPLNQKLAYYAAFWALSVIFTVLIFVPALLAVLPAPRRVVAHAGVLRRGFPALAGTLLHARAARATVAGAAVLMAGAAALATRVQIGESEPGSPLLYPEHDYNLSSRAINRHFPGAEELYLIADSGAPGGIKRPEVLHAIEDLQRWMLDSPDVGASKAVPDLVKKINRVLHSDDPRWHQIPHDARYVGGLFFTYMASSPVPNALKEYITPDERRANVVFYFRDHRGTTVRDALARAESWARTAGERAEGLRIELAAGLIGVTAAINEVVWKTNFTVVPAVLALIFLAILLAYRSWHAAWIVLLSMSFSTLLTYAYMALRGIGVNINTVPMIAVGIGVGIDYSIYMLDRIREEMQAGGELRDAALRAIGTTGFAITMTFTTLIGGIAMWFVLSDLRFQADAALLLAVMLALNALAAILLVPAWTLVARPRFMLAAGQAR